MQSKKRGGGAIMVIIDTFTLWQRYVRRYLLPVATLLPHLTIQGACSKLSGPLAASDLRPIRLDGNVGVKHRTQQHLASRAFAEGGAKPPQNSLRHQALTLASDSQLLQDKKTGLLIRAFVTTQLLRNVVQPHWLPWQTPMCAGCSA
jgi:hypothetical protein